MSKDGLFVEVEPADSPMVVETNYLYPDDIVVVRVVPHPGNVVSFVRTESIHFDIDDRGHPLGIEILGPSVSEWRRRSSLTPPRGEIARLRFIAREQETGSEEAFETNDDLSILRIVITDRPSIRYVAIGTRLLFGIDKDSQLSDMWITHFTSPPGGANRWR
jgi:hypothetical protein